MESNSKIKSRDISGILKKGFEKVRKNLIATEKKNNGYLIVSDKNGNIKKIAAKDL
jgi:hypothetical protein